MAWEVLTNGMEKMNRYNKLKRKALSVFESAAGEWLRPSEAAERLDFLPRRSAWTYLKRLFWLARKAFLQQTYIGIHD